MKTFGTHIDENGRLIIPPEVAQNLGLITGIELMNEENEHSISIPRLITTLKRVYVEITNQCKLNYLLFRIIKIKAAAAARMYMGRMEGGCL